MNEGFTIAAAEDAASLLPRQGLVAAPARRSTIGDGWKETASGGWVVDRGQKGDHFRGFSGTTAQDFHLWNPFPPYAVAQFRLVQNGPQHWSPFWPLPTGW